MRTLSGAGYAITAAIAALVSGFDLPSKAAENASGIYALGVRGPLAGITPPPGFYFSNDTYIYGGSTSVSRRLIFNGNILANVHASAQADFPTLLWVTPAEILGGSIVVSGTEPFGHQSVGAGAALTGPFGNTIARSVSDQTFTGGDPIVSTFIGWHSGSFHWQVGETVNIPIGDYHEGALANIAFHRLAGDTYAAATWFDPKIGIDLSVTAGVTFNGENPTTLYRTGDEFHLEWAATYAFTRQFSAGLVGYYYNQFTADSGPGAALGAFEGQVTALGGTAAYTFVVDKTPVSARVKVFREFDVTNRPQATTGFLTVSLPIPVAR